MKLRDDDDPGKAYSLLGGLGRFIDIMADMVESDKHETHMSGAIEPDPQRKIAGKYDLSIRFLDKDAGGLRGIRTLSDILDREPSGPRTTEPVTDVYEDADRILIVAELPGVRPDDIGLEIGERSVKITASGGGTLYAKKVPLPFTPRPEAVKTAFVNAIYSVEIPRGG